MDGTLGIRKPRGLTSHDVVARLRRATRVDKVGHAGTLDPDAEGTLVLAFGAATRLSRWLTEGRKDYEAEIFFGRSTDTQDATGATVAEDLSIEIQPDALAAALSCFIGHITQTTPMYSAVKTGGRKLYEMARKGEMPAEGPPLREVEIFSITMKADNGADTLRHGDKTLIAVSCSHGTYIRALCEDIGKKLGVPAHMSGLVRTYSSGWSIKECMSLEDAMLAASEGRLSDLVRPVPASLPDMVKAKLSFEAVKRASHGGNVAVDISLAGREVMLLAECGRAVAIADVESEGAQAWAKPKVVFIRPEDLP